jgi:hypothetical protein
LCENDIIYIDAGHLDQPVVFLLLVVQVIDGLSVL